MTITTVFDPPLPTDSAATFNSKAFDTISKLNVWTDEANSTATAAAASQADALASKLDAAASASAALSNASAALSNASAAATSAGATIWVSGTTYAIGDKRWSPINGRVYVRLTVGAGTTDPSADSANWADVISGRRIRITANTNAQVGCLYELDSSAGSFTVTLPSSFNDQDWIGFLDVGMALVAYPVTVARNGNNIRRVAENLILDVSADSFRLTGRSSLGWIEE